MDEDSGLQPFLTISEAIVEYPATHTKGIWEWKWYIVYIYAYSRSYSKASRVAGYSAIEHNKAFVL